MGNLCGKQSRDNFNGPGRTLASVPAPSSNARAAVPPLIAATSPPKIKSQPGINVGGDGAADDPRSAAARAAEERAKKANSGTGDLAKKLDAQKKQTRTQTLEQVAKENRAARDADAALEARNYN